MKVFKVQSEWDMGFGDHIFSNKDTAIRAAKEAWDAMDMNEEVQMFFEDALNDGLISVEVLDYEG